MTVLVLIRLRHYPFIDNATGGSIDGMIRLVNASLERVTDKTIIIPGHGPVGDRAQLIGFRDMLVAIRENVVRLKTQGKSLEEVLAAGLSLDWTHAWFSTKAGKSSSPA